MSQRLTMFGRRILIEKALVCPDRGDGAKQKKAENTGFCNASAQDHNSPYLHSCLGRITMSPRYSKTLLSLIKIPEQGLVYNISPHKWFLMRECTYTSKKTVNFLLNKQVDNVYIKYYDCNTRLYGYSIWHDLPCSIPSPSLETTTVCVTLILISKGHKHQLTVWVELPVSSRRLLNTLKRSARLRRASTAGLRPMLSVSSLCECLYVISTESILLVPETLLAQGTPQLTMFFLWAL